MTENTESTVEAPEAPTTEEAPKAPEAKAPKSTVEQDIETVLATVKAFLKGKATVEACQATYGACHTSRHGAIQGNVMMGAMKAGATPEQMGALYEAFTNLPKVTTSRTKASLTEEQVVGIRSTLHAEASALFASWVNLASDKLVQDAIVAIGLKALATIDGASIGTKATEPGLVDLLKAGSVKAGAELVGRGGKAKATVNADGTVQYKGKAMSVSASAKLASGSKAENGYRYWSIDGAKLASLR